MPQPSFEEFSRHMAHAYVAYRYSIGSIPPDAAFQHGAVAVGSFEFRSVADAIAMRVELGWAFFVRMDAVVEYFVEQCGQSTCGDKLLNALEKTAEFAEHELSGLKQYRDLRNSLHHDDGQPSSKRKALTIEPGREPQFFAEQLAMWNGLFLKIGRVVWEHRPQPAAPG